MRASIVIACHNEGDRLLRTLQSCMDSRLDLECETVVADDASTDGSVEEAQRRFPCARVVRRSVRKGPGPTKDLGARHARGDVLVFLDGHCKPEGEALSRVVADVEETAGTAIVTPRIPVLDCERWENEHAQYGSGYAVELERFDSRWIGVEEMSEERFGYLSPALIGCCFAVSRRLYDWLWGMDRDMVQFGIEDLDFGLKAWLMGSSILHDPRAVIGHRFQQRFDNYTVDAESILSNSLRMARKNFSEPVWEEWVGRARLRYPEDVWRRSWSRFEATRASAERERTYLLEHRVRDELDYAARFGLEWPRRSTSASRYLATSR